MCLDFHQHGCAVTDSSGCSEDCTWWSGAQLSATRAAGQHLRTLRVPGSGISSLSWEGGGLRLAVAVESSIYFANVRPDYLWAWFGSTLVYAYSRPERSEHCVVFLNTQTWERKTKHVKRLVAIRVSTCRFQSPSSATAWCLRCCSKLQTLSQA